MGRLRTKTAPEESKEEPELSAPPAGLAGLDQHAISPQTDKLDQILSAITVTHERIESKIDEVAEGLNLLRDDHRKRTDRVAQTEKDIVALKPAVGDSQKALIDLSDRVRYLEGRAEDAEGRS